MPTYQYRCTDCGESFERYQSFSDDPITVCPLPGDGEAVNGSGSTCDGEVRKIFSNVGISFKGSGFYRNDSRASSGSSSSGSSTSSTTSDSTSESTSKESASSDKGSSKDTSSSTPAAASASG